MGDVNIRVASFLKMVSMLMVIASLIFMYGYAEDRLNFTRTANIWIREVPKSYLFYGALVSFAALNLFLNVGLSIYKNSRGYNKNSYLFRSKEKKEKLVVLINYLIAGANLLITTILIYIALMRINDTRDPLDYIYLPVLGILVLAGIMVAIVAALLRK